MSDKLTRAELLHLHNQWRLGAPIRKGYPIQRRTEIYTITEDDELETIFGQRPMPPSDDYLDGRNAERERCAKIAEDDIGKVLKRSGNKYSEVDEPLKGTAAKIRSGK